MPEHSFQIVDRLGFRRRVLCFFRGRDSFCEGSLVDLPVIGWVFNVQQCWETFVALIFELQQNLGCLNSVVSSECEQRPWGPECQCHKASPVNDLCWPWK